ncbi:zincin [Basidiobolus meristosporus CBS 931.73]|uniref:mitochondrial intermediate peptidase n=1 Tax=Basidiobolus meristosporus CBS 931.73 TaxID=1314790 RepID=A0A1Y1Z569_9FUNG|nr:zincin [Basidiobolus meristosporus CBS 931.73]|eukprot:ORY05442.1 zincin [Basidiobolus meristosporus CBS 931.73]
MDFWRQAQHNGPQKWLNSHSYPLKTGLFQIPVLNNPEGFKISAERALRKAQTLVDKICMAETPYELRRVVKLLDQLSDVLCSVIDLAEFVRTTHPSEEVMEKSNEAYSMMCSYMNTLNTHVGLYESLKKVLATPTITADFSQEERQVAEIFLRDFEKSGIHLSQKQRDQFVALSDKIILLGRLFTQNTEPRIGHIEVTPPSRLAGMNPSYIRAFTRGNTAVIPTSPWEAHAVLRTVHDGEIRKNMYVGANSATEEQISVLEELLVTRDNLAKLLGKESYGHMFLADKMVKNPENVRTFLKTIVDSQFPKYRTDLKILQKAKQRNTKSKDLPSLQAWDRDYYMELVSSAIATRPSSPISPYLSVGSAMDGLSQLFNRLYGVKFIPGTIQPGEVWHDGVRKLEVVNENGDKCGTIYCDLYSRPGKQINAAHYTVRCSRRIDDDEVVGREVELENPGVSVKGRPGKYQLPMVVLVCNFTQPRGKSHPSLLTLSELETLFHEMGHAMHSMLGRTEFHNVAGTRCPIDFVELPSIIMEHFATNPQVLSLFARHHETRKPLPESLLQAHLKSRSVFSSVETQAQILMAMLDQEYHGNLSQARHGFSSQIYAALQNNVALMPYVPDTHWQVQFGHLFGYGAGYYSYLFGRALAQRMWKGSFEVDPLARESGERFKNEVLSWGGGRDPWLCIGEMLENETLIQGDHKAMEEVGKWGVMSS